MLNHNFAPSRLPVEVKKVHTHIQAHVMCFDRVTFWLDHPCPDLPIQELKKHGREPKVIYNKAKQYQPLWQTRVELYQPNQEALRILQTAIKEGGYRSRPDYAEIALDYITMTRQDAMFIRDFLLKHMLVPHARSQVICEEGETYYYNRRSTVSSGKTPHVTSIYSDKPSKLAGKNKGHPCCHLEHRFSGSNALSGIGINCFTDFALFSHESFWRTNLKLARLPSKAEIGRFLTQGKEDYSGTTLRNRVGKFFAPYFLGDVFVLQNFMQVHPEFRRLLVEMESSIMLPGRL